MQKLQIDKEATGIYYQELSKTEFASCSHPSTQYRNEIVADGIEIRYRLPKKHQRSTLNDNTNTNSVSFRPHTIPPGHFFPFTLPRRGSSLVPLSFSLSLFFLIHLLPFFFSHLHYNTSQLCTISFPPPLYSILVRFRLFPGPSPWLHPAKLTRTWVSGSLVHDTLRCI